MRTALSRVVAGTLCAVPVAACAGKSTKAPEPAYGPSAIQEKTAFLEDGARWMSPTT